MWVDRTDRRHRAINAIDPQQSFSQLGSNLLMARSECVSKDLGSLYLDPGCLDNGAPRPRLIRKRGREVVRRTAVRLHPELVETCDDFGGSKTLIRRAVEPRDDGGRRACWCE